MKKLLKKIYHIIPFKKQLFTFLKIFWQPSEKVYRHLSFHGVINVNTDKDHSFKIMHYGFQIENEIFWDGLAEGWEKESFKLWIKLSRTSEVIFDIGANTGVYSLISKSLNPQAKVYAFEPVKRVYQKLVANAELNNYDIVSIDKAVSSYDGEATFFDSKEEHIYSVTINLEQRENDLRTELTKTEVIKLDTFIEQEKLTKVDLVKMDVETHEPEALEGFQFYLNKFRPTILIEILTTDVAERVSNLVKDLDYIYFNIDEAKGIRRVEQISQSDDFNFLLCSKEKAVELGLA